MAYKNESTSYSRRELFGMAGTGVLAAAGVGLAAGTAQADAAAVAAAVKKIAGGKSPATGKISFDLPQIAENGNTVPVGVTVESPMTANDYVKTVHLFADKNPAHQVAVFHFTPACGKAQVSTRMRMIKTQNVVAVAEMSDGSIFQAKQSVKVTIGGCGG